MHQIDNCPVCGNAENKEVRKAPYYRGEKEYFKIVECEACGFWFTNPSPRGGELAAYYESEDYVSHTDGKGGLMDFVYRQVRSLAIRSKLSLVNSYSKSKGTLIDFGAGTGAFLSAAKENGWNTVGFEPSEIARNNAAKRGLDLRDPGLREQIENSEVDAFTLWHVLEHIPDLNESLEYFYQRLKPGGHLFVAVPNHESADAKYYRNHWAALDVPLHLWHFAKADIEALAQKHNFQLREVRNMPFDSFYVSLLSEKLLWGKGRPIQALWQGLKSNLSGAKSKNMSSLIYVLRKN